MDKIIDLNECCPIGSYKHQIPMAINSRRCEIDICIADIVNCGITPGTFEYEKLLHELNDKIVMEEI